MRINPLIFKLVFIVALFNCFYQINSLLSATQIASLTKEGKALTTSYYYYVESSYCYNINKNYNSNVNLPTHKSCKQTVNYKYNYYLQKFSNRTYTIPYVYLNSYGHVNCTYKNGYIYCYNKLSFLKGDGSYQTFINWSMATDSKGVVEKVVKISNKYKDLLQKIRGNIQSLVSDYDTLINYLNRNSDKIEDAQKEITTVNLQITSCKSKITTYSSKISSLTTSNSSLENSLKTLKATKNDLSNKMNSCNVAYNQIEEKLNLYKKYSDETAQKGYQYTFLNKSLDNVCTIKDNIKALTYILPSYESTLNDALASFFYKQDASELDALLKGNDFYIFNEK